MCSKIIYIGAKQIKAMRVHLGMNQEEFAEFLEVGVVSVRRWETGREISPKKMGILQKLAQERFGAEFFEKIE